MRVLCFALDVLVHRQVLERDPVGLGQPARILVVAEDDRQFAVQLAALVAVEQIGQAMIEFRYEYGQTRLAARFGEPPDHPEAVRDGSESRGEVGQIEAEVRQFPFHPHQEQFQLGILMLVGMQDIGVVRQQKIGDGGDQPSLVGAGNQQDGGMTHGRTGKDAVFCHHNQNSPDPHSGEMLARSYRGVAPHAFFVRSRKDLAVFARPGQHSCMRIN